MSKICLMCGDNFPDSTTFCPRDGSALRAAVHGDDLIGEVFCERYVVTDLLGEGGMGAVYLARDVRLPQQVAIKVLRDRSTVDPTLVSRFRQEAEAASRINHDRVARVSDFGFMTDGRAYIIMEYVNGRTLKQTLDKRGTLDPAEAARITSMVAEGLDAAHRLGIVHRDLKPENVMIVDDAGGGMRVKVLDFGIAKVLQGDETDGRTAPGFVIGTPQWMSPEQLLGGTLDARSDVYSLGLLAFAMLTGQRAFSGETEQVEMLARLSTPPRTLNEAAPSHQWPAALQALFNRTLIRDVNQRPANALAFARDLSSAVEETAAKAAPPVVAPSRNWGRVGAAVGGVLVLIVAGVVVVQLTGKPAPAVSATTAPTSDSTAPEPSSPTVPPTATASPGAAVDSTAIRTDSQPTRASVTAPVTPLPSATKPPTGNPTASSEAGQSAGGKPSDGKPTGRAGNAGSAPQAPAADPAQSAAAHQELQRLMDDADADIGKNLDANTARTKARELIRQLDALAPKLGSATDQGWAQFYVGQSQATLGENDKACTALARAHTLSSQSRVLRSNSEQWQQTLSCAKP